MAELPNDIDGLYLVPGYPWWVYALILVLALLMSWFIYRIYKRWNSKKNDVAADPLGDLYQRCLKVKSSDADSRGVALELSNIVRMFLEFKGVKDAVSLTTEEIQRSQKNHALVSMLRQADLVQFAGVDVGRDDLLKMIDDLAHQIKKHQEQKYVV